MEERSIVNYVREHFHAVILFLEDLKYIENLFLKENIEFTISTDLYEKIKSISEMEQNFSSDAIIKEICFKSYSPNIEITFSKDATLFWYDSEKILSKGLIVKIKDYLTSRTITWAKFINAKSYAVEGGIAGIAFPIPVFILLFNIEYLRDLNMNISFKVALSIMLLVSSTFILNKLISSTYKKGRCCKISINSKKPTYSFWEKHEDKIVDKLFQFIVTFVSGILVTVLGLWLTGKLK